MSEDTKTFSVPATQIPGMRITFQGPTAPDGQTLAFELAEDATASATDLDEVLDRVIGAHRRQAAIEELPLCKASLYIHRGNLRSQRRERAMALARQESNMQRSSAGKRNPQPPSPSDVSAVAQFDAAILKLEQQIKSAELRIPYLQALIERREPPELFPEANDDLSVAAE